MVVTHIHHTGAAISAIVCAAGATTATTAGTTVIRTARGRSWSRGSIRGSIAAAAGTTKRQWIDNIGATRSTATAAAKHAATPANHPTRHYAVTAVTTCGSLAPVCTGAIHCVLARASCASTTTACFPVRFTT